MRLAFARSYVQNRQTARPDRPNTPIQIREERTPAYRRELIALLTDVVGVEGWIRGDSESIRLGKRAAAMLCPDTTFEDL